MSRFPLRYAHRNVLFGAGGEPAGLYRLGVSAYPFLPVSGRWALQRRLERLAHTVAADFSVWRVNRAYPAGSYIERTLGLLDERHQPAEVWRAFLEGHRERLLDLDSHVPEVYLAVSLSQGAPAGFGAGLVRGVDRARRRVEELAGIGTASPISHGELEGLLVSEQRIYERLSGVLGIQRASTRELQWLLRRAASRGVVEPLLDEHWQPDALLLGAGEDGQGGVFEPLAVDLERCANAAITERERTLVVDGEQGRSFQAMLALGSLAEAPEFPGASAELLFAPLEAVSFPADAVLHARWLGNRDALGQVRKRIADVENAYSEQLQGSAHGPGLLAGEDRVLAREYEARLQSGGRPPMLYAWVALAVGAPTEQELERRVDVLRESYGDIALHRPAGLQRQLFFDLLPRTDSGLTRDYVQQVTVEQFGALVPTATHTVGAPRGVYLGFTPRGVRRPVRYDATAPSRESRASAVALAGTLGSGKTVTAQGIAYAAERRGSLIVDFDPKPDHGWEKLPELDGRLDVLELSGAPGQQGKLDPLLIGLEELREELACSYLLELLRDPPPSWENAIGRAVKDAVRHGERSALSVVRALCASESEPAREAGEALEVICDFGLARLGFAETGAGGDVVRAAGSVTTIRTPGLSLPDPGASRETYTRAERVSVATLTLVAAYVLRLVSQDRSRHKVVLLDEAKAFLISRQGQAIVQRLVRMGRAFNTTLLLATQLVSDFEELADLIGTWFIGGQESDAEARRALELIGLDPTDQELVRLLREYRAGRCLMRDLDGRVGEVQVDLVHPHLLAAFDTTPTRTRA
jgi:hypothetical protein